MQSRRASKSASDPKGGQRNGESAMLMPKKVKFVSSSAAACGQGVARIHSRFWRLRVEGARMRLD